VFDCDGVIVDTERLWLDIQRAIVAEHERPWDDGLPGRLLGRPALDCGVILARHVGLGAADGPAMVADMDDRFATLIAAGGLVALPGAAALIDALAARAVPLGVASNSRAPDRHLAAVGLLDRFAAVVGLTGGLQPKPAPDLYLEACRQLAVAPSECVAIEDSATGVAAARAAGLAVVGVPFLPGERLAADLQRPSLADLDADAVLAL
jgi:HAD superfamily hydrolase (TIGR01509 family)